jgi:2-hydroxychromene-2-carboxylate isomerase
MKRRLPADVTAWHGRPMPRLDFWYEFASTYSYLAAMRIEPLAKAAGVEVRWRPFLLGPIFKAQGMETSPFNLYPLKGKHMWRDMARWSEILKLPKFVPPKTLSRPSARGVADRDRARRCGTSRFHARGLLGGIHRGQGHRRYRDP